MNTWYATSHIHSGSCKSGGELPGIRRLGSLGERWLGVQSQHLAGHELRPSGTPARACLPLFRGRSASAAVIMRGRGWAVAWLPKESQRPRSRGHLIVPSPSGRAELAGGSGVGGNPSSATQHLAWGTQSQSALPPAWSTLNTLPYSD